MVSVLSDSMTQLVPELFWAHQARSEASCVVTCPERLDIDLGLSDPAGRPECKPTKASLTRA
jgi:hypothetical protein